MAMNFLIAKYSPKGMKKISYVDTSTLRIYRNLIEAGFKEIYFDDIKTVRFKENSALPYFSEVTIIVKEEELPRLQRLSMRLKVTSRRIIHPSRPNITRKLPLKLTRNFLADMSMTDLLRQATV